MARFEARKAQQKVDAVKEITSEFSQSMLSFSTITVG